MLKAGLLLVCALGLTLQDSPAPDYKQGIQKWRDDYARDLQRPEGWLDVAGLFWLQQGENAVGSAPGSQVLLPGHASPAQAGTLTLTGETVTLKVAQGVNLTVNDQPVTGEVTLMSDATG